jgi:hypothetical protein
LPLKQIDDKNAKRIGDQDDLVTFTRPARPSWMSQEEYEKIPETLELRVVRFQLVRSGFRTETCTLVTTLKDTKQYPREEIIALYGQHWNVELDIRQLKQTLGSVHLRCKTPENIEWEFWTILLGYN